MATKIKPLRKFTTGVPSTSDMEVGELAVNTADKKIYMRDNTSGASSIVEVANASGSAADDITLGDDAVTIATSSGDITIQNQANNQDIIFKGNDGGSTITALRLDMSSAGNAKFNNNVNLESDSSIIHFGADKDVSLTHVHNTGLLLNSTSQLQFFDANESISSDGTNLILKSGGTSFKIPTSDGGTGTFLQTDGSGNLSFAAASGGGVTSDSDNNTLAGTGAGANVTSGQGTHNTAFGKDALNDVTTGDFNTAVGSLALDANTDQGRSTAVGYKALSTLSSGFHNTAVGSEAGEKISNGSNNVVMGYAAGYYGTSFNSNISIGNHSMYNSTTSRRNVAIGDTALYGNTYNIDVDNNVAIGFSALRNINDGGHNNVGIGYQTAYNITTGDDNVTIGYESAFGLTTGGQNVFIGSGAAKGDGSNAVTGSTNTFVGYQSGQIMTTGSNNVFLGGYDGNSGGVDLRTSSNNVVLSDGAGNIRARFDSSGNLIVGGTLNGHTIPSGSGTIALTSDISGIASVADDGSPQLGGTLETVGNLIQFGNSTGGSVNQLQFGGSQQLALYHLSNVSYIDSDSPILMSTTSGSITIDNQASDQDIIFKGTDGTSDITPLRLDMSDAGRAKFAANVNVLTSTGGTLTLQNSSTAISANDVLGKIEFQAPNESTGGTSNDVLGAIEFNATADISSTTKAFTEFTIKGSNSSNINQEIVTISGDGDIAMKGDLSHSGSGNFAVSNANGNLNLVSSNNQAKLQGNDILLNSFTSMAMHAQSGNITIDAQGSDTDIIFKGTDGTTDITALTLDMSDAGTAIFNHNITMVDNAYINIGTGDGGADGDLRLRSNSTNGYVEHLGGGSLVYKSNTHSFRNKADNEQLAKFTNGGAVELYYDNVLKHFTKSTGTRVIGTAASSADIAVYAPSSNPIVFTVTVGSTNQFHPYNGDGSSNKYLIDGEMGAALTLHGADDDTSNSEYIYRFDQSDSSNSGHPLRFYLQADKTNPYTTGVTTNGTPGQSGAYTQIAVTKSTPKTLFYQCSSHAYMGNYVTVANSTKFTADNVIGTDTLTATKLRLTSPTNATGSATTHAFQIGPAGQPNLRLDNNQIAAYSGSGAGQTLYLNPQGGTVYVGTGGLTVSGDGNEIKFGTNNEIVLTHVHDTGLLLTDTGGSPTLQLHDSNESVSSDGTNLILTSGGTAFKMPTSDGTGGHFLKTDGSGNLSFAAASGGGSASDSFKTIAVSGQSDVVADSSTDTLTLVASTGMSITTNASNDTITFASSGGGSSDSFKTIAVSGQSDVVADSSTDTLTLVAGNNMTITTNASGDSIEFAASGGAGSGISEEQAIAFAIVYG